MGIPKFYRWISERYPCLSEVINETQVPEFDCLYLDMNGIIHVCSHPSDDVHFRMSEKEMFVDICRYIEVLFRIISPKRTFLMAVDGVAPRAKMNQQRARRFKTAKDAEKKEEDAKGKGEIMPDEPPFDSNCITPGTEFMDRLHQQLKYFTAQKVSTDPKWQSVEIILSGHDVPGEGEHKIMDYIRTQRARPDYDPNTRHCMYGLDADLIMLGLCSHEPHFSLLREEVRFGKFAQQGKQNSRVSNADRTTFHLLHLSLLREYLEMEFKSLKDTLPFPFDVESIIDDWVLLGFLVGNDFLPHLPYLHINKSALSTLHNTYMEVLPSMDGYLNENGHLNLERFEKYCRALGESDREYFDDLNEDMQWMKSKRLGDAIIEHHETHLSPTTTHNNPHSNIHKAGTTGTGNDGTNNDSWLKKLEAGFLFDGDDDDEDDNVDDEGLIGCLEGEDEDQDADKQGKGNKVTIPKKSDVTELKSLFSYEFEAASSNNNSDDISEDNLEYLHWKRVYYIEKFKIQNPDMTFIREQVELYIRALQWNLHYYYHGVQSWSWFYCQHYAPFVSDLRHFTDVDMTFDFSQPFRPYEQLLAVLPARSKVLLPEAYMHLFTEGPIVDFYPTEFELDLNGKQMDWEAVVLIPFIDEKRLLAAMSTFTRRLTKEEQLRNACGQILSFRYDHSKDYEYPRVTHFNCMEHCKAAIVQYRHDKWAIPKENLRHGLLSGVKLDVYFDGFPTTKHLDYTSELRSEGIRVFQSNSRNHNMIITVLPRPNIHCLEDIQDMFFGSSDGEGNETEADNSIVFVKWPYLKEAKVVAVSDTNTRISRDNDGKIVSVEMGTKERRNLKNEASTITDWYQNKRGVVLQRDEDAKINEEKPFVVEVVELVGRKNVFDSKTRTVTLEPRYAANVEVYPFDLCVHGIETQRRRVECIKTLTDMFPKSSTVFLIGNSYYGEEAVVMDVLESAGAVKFQFYQKVEPNFDQIIHNKEVLAMQYYSQLEVAQRLNVPPLLIGRITGSIFVLPPPEQDKPTDNNQQSETSAPHSSASKKSDSEANGNNNQQGMGFGWCVNIGLNLKFTKSNEEVMGFTRRIPSDEHVPVGGGGWLYSEKCIGVIQEYMETFPDMFVHLRRCMSADKFKAQDIFPNVPNVQYELDEVTKYLKGVSCAKAKKISCNSQILEEKVLVQIQSEIERCNIANYKAKRKMLAKGSPSNLFRPSDLNGSLMPDESTQFRMFDRVVNVRDGFCVPVGLRGTVIGLPSKKPTMSRDAILDVLFDEAFLGAHQVMPGTWFSAYRIPATSLINISHGYRAARKRNAEKKSEARILPKATPATNSDGGGFGTSNSKDAAVDSAYASDTNGKSDSSSVKKSTTGTSSIRQLLDKASAAAVNEKMYQKSKASANGSTFTPIQKASSSSANSDRHQQYYPTTNGGSSAFVNFTQQFLENLPQNHANQNIYDLQRSYPPTIAPQQNSVAISGLPSLADIESDSVSHLFEFHQNLMSRQDASPHASRRRGGGGGGLHQGNVQQQQHRQNHHHQQIPFHNSNGQSMGGVDLANVDKASEMCDPFRDLFEQHKMQFPNQPAAINIQQLQTGFACCLSMMGKSYDGPICQSQLEALTEASLGMIKFLNSRVFSQSNEAFQAHPGLYKPQQFYTPHNQNGVPMLLSQNSNGAPQGSGQVLVPGQIDMSSFFGAAPRALGVLGQSTLGVVGHDPAVMAYPQQTSGPQFSAGRGARRGGHRRGGGRVQQQHCAMSFNPL